MGNGTGRRRSWAFMAALLLVGLATTSQAAAPANRYVVTADTVRDTKSNLTWQRAVPASTYTWAQAQTYCSSLMLAGLSGWRLPMVKELQTLVDPRVFNPSIDTTAFPATPATYFWSSSPSAYSATAAWVVGFYGGNASNGSVAYDLWVRCVR